MKEGEGSLSKDTEGERCEKIREYDEGNNKRNKFKKVEMAIFNGKDFD